MIWSEFLKRVQEMDILPDSLVLHVEYDFGLGDDTVAVTFIDEEPEDERSESLPIYGIAG